MLWFFEDKVLEARALGFKGVERVADEQEGVSIFFGGEAAAVCFPVVLVLRIDGKGVGVVDGSALVGLGGDDEFDEGFEGLLGVVAKVGG